MLSLRNCRVLTGQNTIFSSALRCAFSSKGKDPKSYTVTVVVPRGAEKMGKWDEHTNWELLGHRGYKFVLPGNVGLSLAQRRKAISWKKVSRPKRPQSASLAVLPDTNYYRQAEIVMQLAVIAAEMSFNQNEPKELKCKAVDCPFLLREQVVDLFPKAGLGYGPLTAVCVALRCLPMGEITDKDWHRIVKNFEGTAQRVCGKLNQAGFWADFPTKFKFDLTEEPIEVSASQIDAFNVLSSPGPRVMHIGSCVIMVHPTKGSSRVLGWLFTTAPFDHPKLLDIIREENS